MKSRLILGAGLVGGFAALLWIDEALGRPLFFSVLTLVAILLSLAEFGGMVRLSGTRYEALPMAFYSAALVTVKVPGVVPRWVIPHPGPEFWAIFLLLLHLFARSIAGGETEGALRRLSLHLFGFAWIALGLACFLDIATDRGVGHAVTVICVAKATDIGGLFLGRLFGRRKLCRAVSPNKTVEGAVGGLLAAISVAWVCSLSLSSPALRGWLFIPFGVTVSGAAMLGDLAESLVKRDAGIKDSAAWIPGFGGVLDIMDSLAFSAPIALAALAYLPR